MTPDLSILRTDVAGAPAGEARYALTGEIDAYSVAELIALVEDTAAGELERIVLDLDGVEFCDSSGLAGLVRCQTQAQQRGVGLRIRAAPATPIRLLLDLSGLERVFDLEDG